MIDFETYFVIKLVLAVVCTVIVFPIAMWWVNARNRQRKDQA